MDEYVTEVTAQPEDWDSLTAALEAHKRRRPRDGRVRVFIPSAWRIAAIPSRAYCLEAPRPFWQWVRDWRP